ncbi:hypothetical protein Slin15195_G081770 [Septoria linicola]|uniref:Uncharacterized protein n=1 Tax=Septoria linicola TaxID=215465 RepID=A0A9Q9EMV5_9PEZI|nr:hypothetical protein Slin15195_G081770 [Septoria linicola]
MEVITKRCRFLELPGELRNNIYERVLLKQDPVHIDLTSPSEPASRAFALLQTCRQINYEASNLIYENTFEFITSIHAHQEYSLNGSSLTRLRKICQSDISAPKLKHIIVCLDRNLAFENVAHHIGMLFRASEPLRELQKSGVDVAVYVSAQLCRDLAFSPRLQFHLGDVNEAKRELEEGFMKQRIAAGFGNGKDLKTVYFEMLRSRLIEAFFLED